MLQPWEQDKFEQMTEEQMDTDYKEIHEKVFTFGIWFAFQKPKINYIEKHNLIEIMKDIKTQPATALKQALNLQAIIKMYIEYIIESEKFSNYSKIFQDLLSRIDDVIVFLQKFYKKLEEKFAE